MRRTTRAVAVLTSVLLAACADDALTPPESALRATTDASSSCTVLSLADLQILAVAVYGSGSPDLNAVRGRIDNLNHQVNVVRDQGEAWIRAQDIVDFTAAVNERRPLPGVSRLKEFTDAVYCFAGLGALVTNAENTALILPSDDPQIIVNQSQTVAVSLPGLPVDDPSLLTIEVRTTSQLGALTPLDRYPGYVTITLENAAGTQLAEGVRATVSVCAFVDSPPAGFTANQIFDDLRLGHGKRFGTPEQEFVITPRPIRDDPEGGEDDPEEGELNCNTNPLMASADERAPTVAQRLLRSVVGLFAPRTLHATTLRFGGGISGTVTEFSPFEPVDTQLRAGGGISGTITEFIRRSTTEEPALSAVTSLASATTTGCENAPVGAGIPNECLPVVSIRTRQGTELEGVRVDWEVTSSGGTIRPRDLGSVDAIQCLGAEGRSAETFTTAQGTAGVCWTVAEAGTYSVRATPTWVEAPEDVYFVNDLGETGAVDFTVQVRPVRIDIDPPFTNGQSVAPGTVLTPRARVSYDDGSGIPARYLWVDWTPSGNTNSAGTVSPNATQSDAAGLAGPVNWTIVSGFNALTASVRGSDAEVTIDAFGGTPQTVTLNSCPVGTGAGDPIGGSRRFVFEVDNIGGRRVTEVDLFFGATGKANQPAEYRIQLTSYLGGLTGRIVDRTVSTVRLRGSASENAPATFRLTTPFEVPTTGPASARQVVMQLEVLTNPDNATVNFNTGPCPLGNCSPDRRCTINQLEVTGTSTTTLYRRSVGMTVRGN